MTIAEINIYKNDTARYSWSVKDFGAYAEESAGCPMGSGVHTVAGALQAALNAALADGFDGARLTYFGGNGSRSIDTHLRAGVVTAERARAAADALMAQPIVGATN